MTSVDGSQADWRVFDAEWYRFTYALVDRVLAAAPGRAPADVYRAVGAMFEHSPNPYFHERWYLRRYPHVREAVAAGVFASGFEHFLRGDHFHACPHWLFDPVYYRERFKAARGVELEATGDAEVYDHFLLVGQHEGLSGHWLFASFVHAALAPYDVACQIRRNGAFSTYLLQIGSGGPEPVTSLLFDPAWYLARYPAVADEVGQGIWDCALHHYLAVEDASGFDPNPRFSDRAYGEIHFDIGATVRAGGMRNGADHFLRHGQAEGRYFLPSDVRGVGDVVTVPDRVGVTAGFPLRTRAFRGVTLLPCRRDRGSATGSSFGVLGTGGAFLTAFGHPYHMMRAAESEPVATPGTFIYGGVLRAHFGHFLLDGIARLWFMREHPELPVVWHWADPVVARGAWPDWLREVWGLLGLEHHRHLHVVSPVIVDEVVLPDSGLPADNVLHPKQARALAVRSCSAAWVGNRVWFSRRGLPAGFGRVDPEDAIEGLLVARGWTVVRPETLPVAEQADIFATAAVVAGCIGSAFHSVLLCAEPVATLVMITRPFVPMEYFDAIAQARGLRQVYITPELKPFDLANQQLAVEAVDPAGLAAAVCAAADGAWVHKPVASA